MSQISIIDDVFISGLKDSKKHTTRQILGIGNLTHTGHQRFYSERFIPFVSERDIKGRIIKRQAQKNETQKQISLWKICLESKSPKKSINSKTDETIDLRFKLNEINHFKNVDAKSHLEKLPEFRKQLKILENKDYERKKRSLKDQEEFWFTNHHKQTIQQESQKAKNIQNAKHRVQSLKELKSHLITDRLTKKTQQQHQNDKLKEKRSISFKTLLKINRHRNPELQQIQRQVKVHFNHPELDRLKQSRKLDFKFLQNIEKGDKKFKEKVQEYRMIKQRIKKQMTKI